MGTTTWSARPSWERTGGATARSIPSAPAARSIAVETSAVSASVMPDVRSTATIAGIRLLSTKEASSSATAVASAEAGRNEVLSFAWTSPSLPAKGPPTEPTTSQPRIRSAGTSHRHRGVERAVRVFVTVTRLSRSAGHNVCIGA